jgi:hypothetical protein
MLLGRSAEADRILLIINNNSMSATADGRLASLSKIVIAVRSGETALRRTHLFLQSRFHANRAAPARRRTWYRLPALQRGVGVLGRSGNGRWRLEGMTLAFRWSRRVEMNAD